MAASQFDAQRAVRMDAEQLNEYMQELFSWSKDMKRKERAKPAPQPAAVVSERQPSGPAAQGSQEQQQAPPQQQQQQQQQQQASGSTARHPAAHTYEHYSRKWDRFDVDAALAEDEAEGGASTQQASTQPTGKPSSSRASPRSGGPSAPVAIPQARVIVPVAPSKASAPAAAGGGAAPTSAEGWKDAGNAAFKRGQHREAVDCYTRSLALQPSCLAFANRAMARLKLGQAAEAEADCSEALGLDPMYVKAYQRRATARRQLGQLLGALEDCESALRLEPNNKQAAEDRAACVAALLEQEGLQPPSRSEWLPLLVSSAGGGTSGGGRTGTSGTADGAARPVEEPAAARQVAAAPGEPPAGDAFISVAAVKRLKPAEVSAAGAAPEAAKVELVAPVAAPLVSQHSDAEQQAGTTPAAGGSSHGGVADGAMPGLIKAQQAAPPAEQQQPAAQQPPASQHPKPAVAPAAAPAAASPSSFKPPRTGLEFEKAWKGLKGNRQLQAAYLLALQPSALPALLRQALSPGLLAAAAAALLRPGMQQAPAAAVGLLEGLAQVPRFDLNLLSVPPRQQAELAAEWEAAAAELQLPAGGEESAVLAGRLAAARQRYKL